MEDVALGEVVVGVMDELDAAHLRPTGIAARLADGVDAACHGAGGLRYTRQYIL